MFLKPNRLTEVMNIHHIMQCVVLSALLLMIGNPDAHAQPSATYRQVNQLSRGYIRDIEWEAASQNSPIVVINTEGESYLYNDTLQPIPSAGMKFNTTLDVISHPLVDKVAVSHTSGLYSGQVDIVDLSSGSVEATFPSSFGESTSGKMAWDPTGNEVAVLNDTFVGSSLRSEIQIWNVALQSMTRSWIPSDTSLTTSLAWSPNGTMIATLEPQDELVRIWDAATMQVLQELPQSGFTTMIKWGFGSDTFLVASFNGLFLWDLSQSTPSVSTIHASQISSISWGTTHFAAINGSSNEAFVWHYVPNNLPQLIETIEIPIGGADNTDLTWNKDGNQLLIGGGSNLFIWDLPTNTIVHSSGDFGPPVDRFKWNENGDLLATSFRGTGNLGYIEIWDRLSNNRLDTIATELIGAPSVAFGPKRPFEKYRYASKLKG